MPTESRLQLSNRMSSARDALREEEVKALSDAIQERVLGMHEFRTALRVGLYAAFQHEVRTEQLFLEGDRHRKEIYFPALDDAQGGLAYFRVCRLEELLPSAEGFHQPTAKQSRLRDINTLNVLIVPGIAFDSEGRRLGYGKAFYDKCLMGFHGKRVGLAYDFQVVPSLRSMIHERHVDWIVTEKRVIRCS